MPNPANSIESINLGDPQQLYTFVQALDEPKSFLMDRYFTTNPDTDIFNTSSVLIDYNTNNRKLAPFIKVGSKSSERDTFYTEKFEPARIAPDRPISLEELQKRQFGEAVFSNKSPAERAAAYAASDFTDLMNRIMRRKEKMSADCIFNDEYTCTYEDDDEALKGDVTISFHGDTNDCLYVPGTPWDGSNANIMGDLRSMCRILRRRGCPAVDAILGTDVAEVFQKDPFIMKLLDNKNMVYGSLQPVIEAAGACLLGVLNVNGVLLRILQYDECYEDKDGELYDYIPKNRVCITAPGAGKTLYGSVTQLDQGTNLQHTFAGKFVPKLIGDYRNDKREFRLVSRPLLVPKRLGGWISADVLTPAAPGA